MTPLPAILMVDDNPTNLYLLKALLDHSGVELVRAGSGAQALREVLQRDFALILLDVQMPGMDGYETATLIRQRERSSRTPIIFVTAHEPDGAMLLKGYQAGAVDYLFKPINSTMLRSKVDVFVALYRNTEMKAQAAAMEASNRQLEADLLTQAELADQLSHLTQHDLLTGLPNRAGLEQCLAEALAQSRGHSVTVLLIALDSGGSVIDSLGHTASDALLREAAQRLRVVVRNFGRDLAHDPGRNVGRELGRDQNLVAHLGGNEFVLVLLGLANAADAASAATHVVAALATPFTLAGQQITVATRIGIAAAPDDGTDAASLLKAANIALTQSRREVGSGYRFCTAELAARSERRFEIERGLGHALAQDELVLHYQPRMGLFNGGLCGFEALLRWQSPRLGQVGPTEFIPLAESTGLIVSIGEWVLLRACQQAVDWQTAGLDCPTMAVNVSPYQLKSDVFIAQVRAALERSGLAPQHLELEITESAAVFEDADALARLHRLKELGVNISIDDFGTGYSNLSLLKHFQFDRIKVDQSFMRNIAEDSVNRAIATALLALARELRIPVLAEGVETQEQLMFLREHCGDLKANLGGCEVQGYLFGHPLPAEDCTQLLALRQHLN